MSNNRVKSVIIKTEDFFVDKKHEKRMYLLKKSDLIFDQIASAIDNKERLDRIEKKKQERSKTQRDSRIAKRVYLYEFFLFDNDYDYRRIDKSDAIEGLRLKRNEYIIKEDFTGFFRGSVIELEEFINALFDEDK